LRALGVAVVVGAILAFAGWAVASGPARSGWRVERIPASFHNEAGDVLAGISCTSSKACIASGYGGPFESSSGDLAIRLHGERWTSPPTPVPPSDFTDPLRPGGVSCSSERSCEMVGSYSLLSVPLEEPAFAEGWNGTNWSLQTVPSPPSAITMNLNGVSCASSAACVAVGDYVNTVAFDFPLVERWNGTQWAIEQVPVPYPSQGGDLYGVSCTSPSACTAVGAYHRPFPGLDLPLVERWSGRRWFIQKTPNPRSLDDSTLYAVSCTSHMACMAVGARGVPPQQDPVSAPLAERWNGARWSITPTPQFQENFLSSVSCVSPVACAAVGTGITGGLPGGIGGGNSPLAERWNGTRWSVEHPPLPNRSFSSIWLAGVSCPSRSICFLAGIWVDNSGQQIPHAYVQRWTSSSAASSPSPSPSFTGAADQTSSRR
jgi:hypothetical protein